MLFQKCKINRDYINNFTTIAKPEVNDFRFLKHWMRI